MSRFSGSGQADPRITLQKFSALEARILVASTWALMLPNVVSGVCLIAPESSGGAACDGLTASAPAFAPCLKIFVSYFNRLYAV